MYKACIEGRSLVDATQQGIDQTLAEAPTNDANTNNIARDPATSTTKLVQIPLVLVQQALPHFVVPADVIPTVSSPILNDDEDDG